MHLGPFTRCALVLIPLLICAGRLHTHRSGSPAGMTQEVNRMLTMVRVAASRGKNGRARDGQSRITSLPYSVISNP